MGMEGGDCIERSRQTAACLAGEPVPVPGKAGGAFGITQSSLNRYENGQSTPTVEVFRKYADFFDVSMDYIFARCDEPQGKLYHYQPKVWKNGAEMEQFVEMCFDPKSPYYNRMKESVLQMFSENADQ